MREKKNFYNSCTIKNSALSLHQQNQTAMTHFELSPSKIHRLFTQFDGLFAELQYFSNLQDKKTYFGIRFKGRHSDFTWNWFFYYNYFYVGTRPHVQCDYVFFKQSHSMNTGNSRKSLSREYKVRERLTKLFTNNLSPSEFAALLR